MSTAAARRRNSHKNRVKAGTTRSTMMPTNPDRQRDQDRPDRSAPKCVFRRTVSTTFLVRHISTKDRIEVPAALPRQQRSRVDARKQIAVIGEGVRQAPCRHAPSRRHRRARRGTPDSQLCRRNRSKDCTSGIPALRRVANSWLKTRNSCRAIFRRLGNRLPPVSAVRLRSERTWRPWVSKSCRSRASFSATYVPSTISPAAVTSLQRNSMPDA